MIRSIIFDLDGLLVDSEPVWFKVRTEMCGSYGLSWTDDDQKALMGKSTQAWIDYVTAKLQGNLTAEEVKEKTLTGMVAHYSSGRVPVMPGSEQALSFTANRFLVGLASGSPEVLINAALSANEWSRFFRNTLSSDEVGTGKPAPDAYLEMMRRLNVEPAESVVVEDSGSGIVAGKTAGAYVVAVPNPALMPSADALARADVVLASLDHLPAHLESDAIQKR